MSKHILVYSQYFYPEQFRINDMCPELVKRGYKVSVVTGIPNYPEGEFYKVMIGKIDGRRIGKVLKSIVCQFSHEDRKK